MTVFYILLQNIRKCALFKRHIYRAPERLRGKELESGTILQENPDDKTRFVVADRSEVFFNRSFVEGLDDKSELLSNELAEVLLEIISLEERLRLFNQHRVRICFQERNRRDTYSKAELLRPRTPTEEAAFEGQHRKLEEAEQSVTDLEIQLTDSDERLKQETESVRSLREENVYLKDRLKQVTQEKEEAEQKLTNLEIASELVERLRLQTQEKKEAKRRLGYLGELRAAEDQDVNPTLGERRQKDPCDWVISCDEIEITDSFVGRGGYGKVFRAKFRGIQVAAKEMHQELRSSCNADLFEREMRMASRCRHPCLLQFIGATKDALNPLIITELMETSLRELLSLQSLSDIEISVISLDVALALNYLHHQKPSPILHRDISSANVLLWRRGNQWRAKVSDYSTANFLQFITTNNPGNVLYSAPESSTPPYTAKIDVYSFGVLLLEMCVGQLPPAEIREEHISQEKAPVFQDLIERCVQSNPDERPEMQEIIVLLQAFYQNQGSTQESHDWNIPIDQIQLWKDRILGRGDYGVVFEGKYFNGAIAVKQMHDDILSSHNRSLFEGAINIARKCRHPYLVQFIGAVDIGDGGLLLLTELMESSLRKLLDKQPLTETEISLISQDVTGALSYLHQKKPSPIIHRNISSYNVLLWQQEKKWRGKLTISGATSFQKENMTTAPGDMRYGAPEIRTSTHTVKVDIYSFGVLLCEMCIRKRPDPERREEQVVKVTKRNIQDMIRKCIQSDPKERPGLEEIVEDLD